LCKSAKAIEHLMRSFCEALERILRHPIAG
jgi:hypothetical protein